MSASLRDVAKSCGVDASTVSRALKDDPRISQATAQRIKAAASDLGYQPNLAARMLKQGNSRIVWVLVPALDTIVDCRIAERASVSAALKGYDTAIAVHHGRQEDFERLMTSICSGLAAGVIINRRDIKDTAAVKRLVQFGFPVVFIDVPVYSMPLALIATDHHQATVQLLQRLAELGARSFISLFDPSRNRVEELRIQGMTEAAEQLGFPCVSWTELPEGEAIATGSAPIGVVGSNQKHLAEFARKVSANGAIPNLLGGCFDEYVGSPYPFSKIVVAVQDYEAIADAALEHLFAIIENQPPRTTRLFPPATIETHAV